MINVLKLKHSNDNKVFVFSDIHYRHNPSWPVPLWKMRGFNSVQEHDATIAERIIKKIKPNDTLILLGDTVVGAGKDSTEVFKGLIDIIPCNNLYVMAGNHGSGYKQLFKGSLDSGQSIDEYYRLNIPVGNPHKIVYFIPNYYEVYVNGQAIVLSHYALLSWNGMNKGSIHLFGHSHNNLSNCDWVKNNYLCGKCLDVGPESVHEPISFSEIMEIMKDRKVLSIDHHDKDTSSPFA